MSKQQPQATVAAYLGDAEEGTDNERYNHLLYDTDPSYNSNNAVSYVQHKTVNNTDGLQVSNEKSTHTTSPYETCTTSKSCNRSPINLTDIYIYIYSCNMQTADAQDQLPIQEVCYLINGFNYIAI